MKSYTDLEQSKKLAEILPLESADMEYLRLKETNATIGSVPFVKDESEVENSAYNAVYDRIPCWSLAALLNVIPDFPALTQEDVNEWEVCVPNYNNDEYIEITEANPVDACYELILKKLHKLKFLRL